MYQLIKDPYITQLNPHLAERLLTCNQLDSQRSMRPRLVNIYSNKIRDGLFRSGEIATAKLNYNGQQLILVNGQHQCHSVIVTGKTVKAKFEEYICDTPEDLSLLYAQFDTEGTRSLSDLVRMEAMAHSINWPPRIASLVVSAAAYREGKTQAPKTEKASLLKEYLRPGAFINTVLNETVPDDVNKAQTISHMTRSPVAYAMIQSWHRAQAKAFEFWSMVRDGEGLKRTMPAYVLRDFLKTSSFDRGRGVNATIRTVGFHEMASRCIIAWNAYRKDKTTKLAYHRNKPIPAAI